MKVAVPTVDGTSISQHFGRSKSFFVFDIDDGKVVGRPARAASFVQCRYNSSHLPTMDGLVDRPETKPAVRSEFAKPRMRMGQRASSVANIFEEGLGVVVKEPCVIIKNPQTPTTLGFEISNVQVARRGFSIAEIDDRSEKGWPYGFLPTAGIC